VLVCGVPKGGRTAPSVAFFLSLRPSQNFFFASTPAYVWPVFYLCFACVLPMSCLWSAYIPKAPRGPLIHAVVADEDEPAATAAPRVFIHTHRPRIRKIMSFESGAHSTVNPYRVSKAGLIAPWTRWRWMSDGRATLGGDRAARVVA